MMLLLALLAAAQDAAPPPAPPPSDIVVTGAAAGCGPPFARTYIAPMGQPFRTDGQTDPMKAWFTAADADHDGRLTLAEFLADADRYFTVLDRDHSGEIDPEEMSFYENTLAPEIKLYQRGQDKRPRTGKQKHEAKAAARRRADYEAPYGAGIWASLNIPQPIVSADLDLNRGVSRAELAAVASRRFPLLDPTGRGTLTYDTLPRSPAQKDIDACRAEADRKKR